MPLGGLITAGLAAAGPILKAVAPAAISAGVGLLGSAGGTTGGITNRQFRQQPGLASSALNISPFAGMGRGRGFDVSLGPGFQEALSGFQSANLAREQELRGFLPQLRPGFGELTTRGVGAIQRAGQRRVSDIRGASARRRIAGSSFAQGLVTSAEAETGRQEAEFRAQSFLQELNATLGIIDQASQASIASAQAAVNAMQFEAQIGAQFVTGAASNITQIAQTNAQLAAQNAQANAEGFGAFGAQLGQVGSQLLDLIPTGGGGT